MKNECFAIHYNKKPLDYYRIIDRENPCDTTDKPSLALQLCIEINAYKRRIWIYPTYGGAKQALAYLKKGCEEQKEYSYHKIVKGVDYGWRGVVPSLIDTRKFSIVRYVQGATIKE